MDIFKYSLPTKVVFGSDTINELPKLIKENFPKKSSILLVTGRSSLKKQGITDKFLKILEKYTIVLFDKVEANPTSDIVYEGIETYKKHRCDLVIAVGGGSVMDAGKAIAILVNNQKPLEVYQSGEKPEHPSDDFIAIPTTSGTSSEMTVWSVITNKEGAYKNTKKSFSDEKMYPKLAVIDPKLTLGLSAYQTASTGLDVLSHAMEGFWSKKKNPISDLYALEAIKLVVKYLPTAYKNGSDLVAREKMSFATLLAGFAFSNSRTTSPHKVSYPLTTQYQLPHGAACAVTLPYFMHYIGKNDLDRLQPILNIFGVSQANEALNFLKTFIKDLDMPCTLKEVGVEEEDLDYIARKTYAPIEKQEDPVPLSFDDYLEVLKLAYGS